MKVKTLKKEPTKKECFELFPNANEIWVAPLRSGSFKIIGFEQGVELNNGNKSDAD